MFVRTSIGASIYLNSSCLLLDVLFKNFKVIQAEVFEILERLSVLMSIQLNKYLNIQVHI